MKKLLPVIVILFITDLIIGQTIIINEFSNGPAGSQEYIEFVVVDTVATYNCLGGPPPCVDIRGWIIDDNSGYHGTGGIAAGCNRFSFNSIWQCVPLGTIILVYNNSDPNIYLPAIDLSMSDNNCKIVAPINNTTLFESNSTTPGASACSYPATGWTAGGIWTRMGMANSGDCARLVNLAGCEVSSMCYGDVNLNTQIYFASGGGANPGSDNVWFFNGGTPTLQTNWSEGCADNETTIDASSCGSNAQTPGSSNNIFNAAYIAQFNNNCQPITPISSNLSVSVGSTCNCDGTATVTASGSIGPYTFAWYSASTNSINQTTATASNLCAGNYYCVVSSVIGCSDTVYVSITNLCNFGTFASATMVENCLLNQFYNTTAASFPDEINQNGIQFNNFNYGDFFSNSNTLILNGGEVKTWKNPGGNVCGAKLNYTIYTVGNRPANPIFTILNLPFKESCNVGPNSFPTGGPCFNASDQKWAKEDYGIDLTTYPAGNYVLEVFYSVPGSNSSTTGCSDTVFVNNSGTNYLAYYQLKDQPAISANGPVTFCAGGSVTLSSNYASGNLWSTTSTAQSITVSSSGNYLLTVDLNNNCPDLTDTEIVTVTPASTVNAGLDQTICEGAAVTLNGSIGGSATGFSWSATTGNFSNPSSLTSSYSTTTTQTVTLTATGPCPSVQDNVLITVNATPTINAGLDQQLCEGGSINLTGQIGGSTNSVLWSSATGTFSNNSTLTTTYSAGISSGTVTLTLTGNGPCPSVSDAVILTIVANTTPLFDPIDPICSGDLFVLPNQSLNLINGTWSPAINASASTNYFFTPNSGQCASNVNTTVLVNPNYTITENRTICANELPYSWNGVTFTAGGTQNTVLNTVNNCDSIITMNLEVSTTLSSNNSISICENQLPYNWNGIVFNAGGAQTTTLQSTAGCDSLATLTLTVFNTLTSITNQSICSNELPYNWNGLNFTSSGNQSITLSSVSGCDSIATLNLTVNTIPPAPLVGSDSTYCQNDLPEEIYAVSTGTVFWYSDANLTEFLSTNPTLFPTQNIGTTEYFATQLINGCQGPSASVFITFEECNIIIPTAFTPDGDNSNDYWQLTGIDQIFPKNKVYIYNRWGNLIFESTEGNYEINAWNGLYNNELMPVGTYYFIIEFNDGNRPGETGIVSLIK
jgi:gliding motility-associated-like protein